MPDGEHASLVGQRIGWFGPLGQPCSSLVQSRSDRRKVCQAGQLPEPNKALQRTAVLLASGEVAFVPAVAELGSLGT